ncbi:MAG: hypothetical protein QM820_19245 [Minicystis sp.]
MSTLAIVSTLARPAMAQPPGPDAKPAAAPAAADAERAQALFNTGRAAMEGGHYAAACAALTESLGLVVRSNTLFNLAQCEEHEGRLVDAQRHWQQGVELLPPQDERLAIARARIEAIGRRVPRLSIQLAGDAPQETKVTLDGRPIAPAALAQPIAVNPGAHALVVSAPAHAERRLDVTLAEGEAKTVLLSLSTAISPPPGGTPPVASPGRPVLGWVLGGVGIAGFVVAGVTGGLLVSRHAEIDKACPDKVCTPAGRRLIDGTGPLDITNAIGWGVGAAGVVSGALVLLIGGKSAPPRASLVPAVVAGGGGFAVTGSF